MKVGFVTEDLQEFSSVVVSVQGLGIVDDTRACNFWNLEQKTDFCRNLAGHATSKGDGNG